MHFTLLLALHGINSDHACVQRSPFFCTILAELFRLSNWLFYYKNYYILSTKLLFMATPRLEDCVTSSGCVTSGFDSRIMQKVIQFFVIVCLFRPFPQSVTAYFQLFMFWVLIMPVSSDDYFVLSSLSPSSYIMTPDISFVTLGLLLIFFGSVVHSLILIP